MLLLTPNIAVTGHGTLHINRLTLLRSLIWLCFGYFLVSGFSLNQLHAQPNCFPEVPHFVVDLTGNPDSSWYSPSVVRDSQCCNKIYPDQCIAFTVTLDEDAIGLLLNIDTGASPPGHYYQVNCGPDIPFGTPACLNGGETYYVTFCKPGANQNVYGIHSVPGLIIPDTTGVQADCNQTLTISGPDENTITWNDITSSDGRYNDFLTCTSGCYTTQVFPDKSAPPTIMYEVCGQYSYSGCLFDVVLCDTVLVDVFFLPDVTFTDSIFCGDEIEPITAILSEMPSTYTYYWYDGPNGTGNLISTTTTMTPTQSGVHSFVLIDDYQGGCSRDTFDLNVTIHPVPVLNFTTPAKICPGDTVTLNLDGSLNYQWMPMTGVEAGNPPGTFHLTPSITTNYTVVATDINGCDDTSSVTVPVTGCIECPPPLAACDINEVPAPYATVAEFLNAGGTTNFPCTVNDDAITLLSEVSDGNSCPETITRTYTIIDVCGESDTCSQLIVLNDVENPLINCPSDVTIDCDISTSPPYSSLTDFISAGGSVSDNCAIDPNSFQLLNEVSDGNTCPEVVTRTYQIADSCGNLGECTQILTIIDTMPPVLSCPADSIAECSISEIPAYQSMNEFVADGGVVSDNCGIDSASFILLSETSNNSTCPETITRTYQVSDNCGNMQTCVQSITVDDTQAPTLNCPSTGNAVCSISEIPPYTSLSDFINDGGTAYDSCGILESSFMLSSETSDGNSCPETITRVYEITDSCGNLSTCTQIILVNDSIPPAMSCPTLSFQCIANVPAPYATLNDFINAGGTASDNCGLDEQTFSVTESDSGLCPRIIERVYTISDSCGNTVSCTQSIAIDDTISPVISCPANETVECIAEVPEAYSTYSGFIGNGGAASDNCGVDTSSLSYTETDSGTCPRIIIRTYEISDSCGNTSSCTQTITVNDITPPTISCPQDLTFECFASVPPVLTTYTDFINNGGSASDNCGLDESSFTVTETDAGTCPRTITRVYEIADSCGNTTSCTQTITVNDITPPTISCPQDLTFECFANVPPALTSYTDFINNGGLASDNCGLDESSLTFTETDAGTCPRTITRVYEIADSCGNTTSCTQTITVNDITPPTITCPADLTFECSANVSPAHQTLSDFLADGGTAGDNCGLDEITFNVTETDAGTCPRIITRVYEITDSCGNISSCTQTITVDDVTPPTISCPADETHECYADVPPAFTTLTEFLNGGGSASDNCGLDETTFNVTETDAGTCLRIITRVYEIADSCGNQISCTHTFTIDDVTPPTISCPGDLSFECLANVPPAFTSFNAFVNGGGSASDNCGLVDSSFTVTETDAGTCPRIITRVYEIADSCGNTSTCTQTITVDDITPPIISCPADLTFECAVNVPDAYTTFSEFINGGGSASDNCGLDETTFTVTITDAGTCPRTITRVYEIADSCGNISSCTQTITVDDVTPPTISCPADETHECFADVPPAFTTFNEFINGGGSASDNCGLDETTFTVTVTDAGSCPRTITRVYEIADSCGNTSTCTQIFTIDDVTPPAISCPADETHECFADVPPAFTTFNEFINGGGSASDNCGLDESTFTVTVTDAGTCPRTITRVYEIADSCGNTSSCTQTFTIDDVTPPAISCPADETHECFADLPPAFTTFNEFINGGGTASDNCGLDESTFNVTVTDAGTCPRTITRVYEIADSCGNNSSCTQTFTIDDVTPPAISCPADETHECYADVPPAFTTFNEFINGGGTASDNCGLDETTFNVTVTDAGTCPRTITRVYEIADSCGNITTCTQTITVDDVTPPTISCPADLTFECSANVPPAHQTLADFLANGGTASDNCGLDETTFNVSETDAGTCPRIITRVYEIADSCGNTSTCTQTITVDDITPPTISCPADETHDCFADVPPAFTTFNEFINGGGSASDNCGLDETTFTVTITDAGTCPRTITRVYEIADSCGNVSSCTQTITVDDVTPPTISCPADETHECFADVPPAFTTFNEFINGGGSASDNCGLDETTFTVTITDAGTCPRTITRVYEIADSCGNTSSCTQTFTIDDVTPPTISCPADETHECYADVPPAFTTFNEFINGGGSASDNCGLDETTFTVTITDAGTCPRTITRVYEIADSCGNTSSCTQTFTIDDVTPPTISCPADETHECYADVPPAFTTLNEFINGGGTASDNCGLDETTFNVTVTDAGTCPRTITRVYEIADSCGNTSTCTQIFTIDDVTPPTISCPADETHECFADVPPAFTTLNEFINGGGSASDNCGLDETTFAVTITDAGTCPRTITRVYEIADSCGNVSSCTQTITVDDVTPPTITCPADLTFECFANVPPAHQTLADFLANGGTAGDNCGLVETSFNVTETDAGTCPRTITRVYEIADSCGNISSCTQTITVDDVTPPTITCPADETHECYADVPPPFTTFNEFINGGGTASDNCGLDETTFNFTETDAGTCPRTITRVYEIADSCGNINTCTQTITVDDITPPTITCPADETHECYADVPPPFTTFNEFINGGGSASDNCGLDETTFNFTETDAGTCPRTITRVYEIADSCGNVNTCTQTITVDDITPPTITCPADETHECYADVPPPFTTFNEFINGGGTASDNCGLDETTFNVTVTDAGTCPRTITRVYEIADSCGNTSSCTQTITIDDVTPPTITCPQDLTFECSANVPPAHQTLADFLANGGTASDNCGLDESSFNVTETDAGTCPRTITRIYEIADSCGNISTCTQTITVDDITPPTITCPADETHECFADVPPAFTNFNEFINGGGSASDNCGLDESSFNLSETDAGTCPRTITRVYEIADSCGNISTCTQTITVDDVTPPTITCPGDLTFECSADVPPAHQTLADFLANGGTASDNCGLDETSFSVTETDAGTCPRIITRIYEIADSCGNTNTCTQTITIDDLTPPNISCPGDLTFECSASIPPALTSFTDFINNGGSASDNCGLDTASFNLTETDAGTCPRTITRIYEIADSCGNINSCTQTITVDDLTPPNISCPGDLTFECSANVSPAYTTLAEFLNGGGSVSDNCGLDTSTFMFTETDNGSCPKVISRTYEIQDSCGNVNTCTQTITVEDITPPTISCPGDLSFECASNVPPINTTFSDFINNGGIAFDNCGLDTGSFSYIETDNGSCPKVISRTYEIQDSCGNVSTCTQTITVEDITPPTISCPGDLNFECSANIPPAFTTFTDFINNGGSASDNCGLDTASFNLTETDAGTCPRIITRIYEIADSCGNINTCTQTITVDDVTPPEITCPADETHECYADVPPAFTTFNEFINGGGSASDNCGLDESSFNVSETDAGTCPRIITRVYEIADSCGNLNTCTQTITIDDTAPPAISCPADESFECSSDVPPAFNSFTEFINGGGTASDNCGLDTSSFNMTETDAGTCPRTITRVYEIADSCGNVNSCTQTITIDDTAPPAISCPGDLTFDCVGSVPPGYTSFNDFINNGGAASDNCGLDTSTFSMIETDAGTCPRTITRVYEIADSCGNVNSCTQTITVDDTAPPAISCPGDLSFECLGSVPPPLTSFTDFINNGGSASDNCGLDTSTFTITITDGGTCPKTITRVYEIADSCGNTNSCTQTITIDDSTPPTIACPGDLSFDCIGNVPPALTNFTDFINNGGSVSDNCGLDTSTFTLIETDNGTCPKTITRTYEIQDSCGNPASCTQTITVDDSTPPTISCPADLDFDCIGNVPPPLTNYNDFINNGGSISDNCGIDTSSFTLIESNNGSCPKTITRTYEIQDSCGNVSSCTQSINIDDTSPPTITCPGDLNFECEGNVPPLFNSFDEFLANGGSASDNCGLDTTTFDVSETISGICPKTITRVYEIADSCGNVNTCTQTITIVDNTPPNITCPSDLDFECVGEIPPVFSNFDEFIIGGGSASDNCALDTSSFSFTETDQGVCPRIITRTYEITDSCGNTSSCTQSISIDDTTPPTITCPGDLTFECIGEVPPGFSSYSDFISNGGTAIDNCGLDTSSFSMTETNSGTCPRIISRVYEIQDSCGNLNTCTQTITIEDVTPPSISCPPGLDFECVGNIPPAFTSYSDFINNGGSVSENCALDTSSFTFTETDAGTCPRVVTRTYEITDSCGNTSSCTQSISIDDTTPPTISCPGDLIFECIGDIPPPLTNFSDFINNGGSASDNCGLDTSSFSLTVTDGGTCPRTITRVYEIADSCGNINTCTQTITIDDITQPVISCPGDLSFECEGNVPPPFTTYNDFINNGGSVFENCAIDTSSFNMTETDNGSCPKTITRTYEISDSCGNVSTCSQSITVNDNTPPEITCPADLSFECAGAVPPAYTSFDEFISGGGSISDNCGLDTSTFTMTETDNGSCPRNIVRTYEIADSCGNINSCTQTITVDDVIPPVISCPGNLTFECTGNVPPVYNDFSEFINAGGSASDNCGLDTSTFLVTETDNGTCPRIITRVYEITDSCGNTASCTQTFTIDDTTPPDITCPGDLSFECIGDVPPAFTDFTSFINGGVSVSDNCELDTGSFSFTESTSGFCPQIISRTYEIEDSCGNVNSCTQTITIDDTTPPVMACPGNITYECFSSVPPIITSYEEFLINGGTITDNCGLDTASFSANETESGTCPRIITRTYQIEDSCGNTISCSQTITVDDSTPPIITCPADLSFECVGNIPPAYTSYSDFINDGGTASDNCGLDTTTFSVSETDAGTCPRIVTRTYEIADSCGNVSTCVQTISIEDNTPPVISCPSDLLIECIGNIPPVLTNFNEFINAGGSISDNCALDTNSFNVTETDAGTCPRTISRTYEITDSCGNVNTCTQLILIDDTVLPAISCPGDLTFDCVGYVPPPFGSYQDFLNGGGSASDNCGLDTISFSMTETTNGSCPMTITRTYEIADSCGNVNTCTQLITINDNVPPTITCPADLSFECIDSLPALITDFDDFLLNGGAASDNCGLDTASFTVTESETGNCPKTITRTYEISDSCGNVSICTQSISISDDIAPEITCPAGESAQCYSEITPPVTTITTFIAAGGTISDNCALDTASFQFLGENSNGGNCPETIIRTYQIADLCGNVSTCTQEIIISDTIPPTLDPAPQDTSVECINNLPPMDSLFFMDNCGSSGYITGVQTSDGNQDPEIITRTWSVSDGCNNTVVETQIIQVFRLENDTVMESICEGDIFNFNDSLLNTEGTYLDTLTAQNGCDSIIVLELTVIPTEYHSYTEEICEGEVFDFNGTAVDTSGIYVDTLISSNGCDSVITLDLTVLPPVFDTLQIEICSGNSYDFNGTAIDETGTYFDSLATSQGCDSIVVLELDVLPPLEEVISDSICSGASYNFNGTLLANSGTYVDTLSTSEGCDSIVTLELFILPPITETINVEVCEGVPYEFNGNLLDQTGVYIDTFSTPLGCDSIVTLNLLVLPPLEADLVVDICEGGAYDFNGNLLDSVGFYVDTFQTIEGCDSIVYLELTASAQYSDTLNVSICQGGSYNFNGTPLSSPGVYYDTLYNPLSCDTAQVLFLETLPLITDTIKDNFCFGGYYDFFGQRLDQAGVYTELVSTPEGCDSLVTLLLEMNPADIVNIDVSICPGGTYNFNGQIINSPGLYTDTLRTNSQCDSIVQLTVSFDDILSDTIQAQMCAGGSYVFNGFIYDQEGTYIDTLRTIEGCDSLIVLELSTAPAIRQQISDEICQGDEYNFHGTLLTSPGTYSTTLTTSEGCDSIVTLELSFNNILYENIQKEICENGSFEFNGQVLTEPGFYSDTLTSKNGCDSIVLLELLVAEWVSGFTEYEICEGESVRWNGKKYTESTFEFKVIQGSSVAGCDSFDMLILTVHPTYDTVINVEICEGESYYFNRKSLTETGTYTANLVTKELCDSTVTLNLNVLPRAESSIQAQICEGEGYMFNGELLKSEGFYEANYPSASGCDSIVTLELSIAESIFTETAIEMCQGQSFEFNGELIFTEGTYYDTLETAGGCDSIVELNLSFTESITSEINAEICEGEEYDFNGNMISTAGLYYDTLTSQFGCDSIVALQLSYLDQKTNEISAEICNGQVYNFNGNLIDEEGVYFDTLQTSEGCDSIVTLELALTDQYTSPLYAEICEQSYYDFNGLEVRNEGIYYDTLVSSGGCDSILILTLDIIPAVEYQFSVAICKGDSFELNGQTYNSPGLYIDTLVSASGCDSIIALDLSIEDQIEISETASICPGESYNFNGQILYEDGLYRDTFTSVSGCDSIVTLTLNELDIKRTNINGQICEGGTYNFGNIQLSEPGVYRDTLSSITGCDSIIELELIETNAIEVFATSGICEGDSMNWQGQVIKSEGIYTDTIERMSGCDSIVHLEVSIHESSFTQSSLTICEGGVYEWNGQNLTDAGYYIDTLQSSEGCDSIVALELSVAANYRNYLSITICLGDTFTYNGIHYFESGLYQQAFEALNGCDSIVNIDLEVLSPVRESYSYEFCAGDTININGQDYTQEGVFQDTLTSYLGCDSIVSLNLSTIPSNRDTIRKSICEGLSVTFRGRTYRETGIYSDTVRNSEKCQEIYVLELTVYPNILELDIGEDITINAGEQIQFDPWVNVPWETLSSILWTPGEGLDCTNCFNPITSPQGDITYTLTVVDSNGCDISDRINIKVKSDLDIYIPNVFTPDGDGTNDMFYIHTSDQGVEEVELLLIYDRWGELVFESRHFPPNVPGFGWDGTFRGQDMNPAVFVYVAVVKLEGGRTIMLKGDVTLVR